MSWLASNTFEIQNLTPVLRLSGAGTGDEGEAAALKASAKEAGSLEDKQLAEALARFQSAMILMFAFFGSLNALHYTISGLPQTTVWTLVNQSQEAQEVHLRLQPLPKRLRQKPSKNLILPTLCPWALPERYSSFFQAILIPSPNPPYWEGFSISSWRLVPQDMFMPFLTPLHLLCCFR